MKKLTTVNCDEGGTQSKFGLGSLVEQWNGFNSFVDDKDDTDDKDDKEDKEDVSGRAEDASDFCLLLSRRHDLSLHQPYHVKLSSFNCGRSCRCHHKLCRLHNCNRHRRCPYHHILESPMIFITFLHVTFTADQLPKR